MLRHVPHRDEQAPGIAKITECPNKINKQMYTNYLFIVLGTFLANSWSG
jgi:hypothetical protein